MDESSLGSIRDALRGKEPLPLRWMVEWSRFGGDPLVAAWNVCDDEMHMMEVAWVLKRDAQPIIAAYWKNSQARAVQERAGRIRTLREILDDRAAKVRALVSPPTMDEFEAAMALGIGRYLPKPVWWY